MSSVEWLCFIDEYVYRRTWSVLGGGRVGVHY